MPHTTYHPRARPREFTPGGLDSPRRRFLRTTVGPLALLAVGCGAAPEPAQGHGVSVTKTSAVSRPTAHQHEPATQRHARDERSGDAAPPLGVTAQAPPGARGVDTYQTISAAAAAAIVEEGYVFAVRYIRNNAAPRANHITRAEANDLLDAGLAVLLVQQGRGWHKTLPSAALGARDGRRAVAEAAALGYPAGATLFLDVESVRVHAATPSDILDFASSWHTVVKSTYRPGYYVGPGGRLSAPQLASLPFEHFWKSGAEVPEPTKRGFQLTQHRHADKRRNTVHGVSIDFNITQPDERGDALTWLTRPRSERAP